MEEAEENLTTIFDLNDDCLIEIVKFLDCFNLANLKEAHSIFHAPINHTIAAGHVQLTVSESDSSNKKDVEKVFKALGNRARALNIHLPDRLCSDCHNGLNEFYEQLIHKYCAEAPLKQCTFTNFVLSQQFVTDNLGAFERLETLKIDNYRDEQKFRWIFDALMNLKNLFVVNPELSLYEENLFLGIASSKLEKCSIQTEVMGNIELANLPVNKHLKCLHIKKCGFDLTWLSKTFPNLESVTFHEDDWDTADEMDVDGDNNNNNPEWYALSPLLKLTKLKHLCFWYCLEGSGHLANFLGDLAKRNHLIETLKLNIYNGYGDLAGGMRAKMEPVLARSVCKLTNLRRLNLSSLLTFENHLEEFARALPHLTNFKLACKYEFVDGTPLYGKMLKFVKLARNLVTLKLKFNCNTDFNDEKFYNQLVQIRRKQKNDKILYVHVSEFNVHNLYDYDSFDSEENDDQDADGSDDDQNGSTDGEHDDNPDNPNDDSPDDQNDDDIDLDCSHRSDSTTKMVTIWLEHDEYVKMKALKMCISEEE